MFLDLPTPPLLVLSSRSPRRAAVLAQLGLAFEISPVDLDERPLPGEVPASMAERLAREKARRGASPRAISLGFDTLVSHQGEILGKPATEDDACRMLVGLAGEEHEVFTGVAAATPERIESVVERTRVRFRPFSREEAAAYVSTGEPMDKAGAYGIQGAGAALVASVEGDFFNVMGFPIQGFQSLLARFGWRYGFGEIVAIEPED